MKWRVEFRPEVEHDVACAAAWYNAKEPGLASEFVEDVIQVWDSLADNPMLNSKRHRTRNIRWRFPASFPYRVIYGVIEAENRVVVAAVIHASMDDITWRKRLS